MTPEIQAESNQKIKQKAETNLPCQIITDLLPLYIDGLCTDESKKAVEAHLETCPDCSQRLAYMSSELSSGSSLQASSPAAADQARERERVKRGIKKLRHRWAASLLAAVLILPLLFLTVNQFRGEGLAFTNLDDFVKCYHWCLLMKNGQYGEAFDALEAEHRINWESIVDTGIAHTNSREEETRYREVTIPAYLDMGYETWRANARAQFISSMEAFEEKYGAIRGISFKFDCCYAVAEGWSMGFSLRFEGEGHALGGIELCSGRDGLMVTSGYHSTDHTGAPIEIFLHTVFTGSIVRYEFDTRFQ